jgi:GNAT superfamily N-acetyltransferase
MSVYIEKATLNDVFILDKIQKSAFKRLYDIYNDEGSPYLRGTDEILNWLAADDVYYWKIYFNSALCGGIVYFNRSQGEIYLARLYIAPSCQNRGIARQAILLCEKELDGVNKFTLDFPIDQIANKACYESVGYADTGKREKINDKLMLAVYEKNI